MDCFDKLIQILNRKSFKLIKILLKILLLFACFCMQNNGGGKMKKMKSILVSLSFAFVMAMICAYAMLPTQAVTSAVYWNRLTGKDIFGVTLYQYTLYENVTLDGTHILWNSQPYSVANTYVWPWSAGSPNQWIVYNDSSEIIVQGYCHFYCWPQDVQCNCQTTIYGTGTASYKTWT